MLNLVLADNLFQVFVSWELVGICSYLLIGFYYERHSASNAANKAFITNRIGDAGFIIGLLILWTYVGTFNFEEIFREVRSPTTDAVGKPMPLAAQIVRASPLAENEPTKLKVAPGEGPQVILFPPEMPAHLRALHPGEVVNVSAEAQLQNPGLPHYQTMPYWLLVAAGLGIFLGCVGKSAQFPLHVWLPDAMEGPTPVSALIHAATMVAAGVYLVGRCYPLFTPEARLVIAYTGGITLFLAATIAVVMTDIKKVLAYSTVSQLGYMMLALGVGGWVAGLFHLHDARLLQGAPVPRLRQRHLRLPSRAGHDAHGRPLPQDEDHRPDHARRRPDHRRHPVLQRLVQQGRDPRAGVRLRLGPSRAHLVVPAAAGDRRDHHLLHVPHVVPDLHRASRAMSTFTSMPMSRRG